MQVPPVDNRRVSARTRAVMRGNRSRDTKPELALRRELHARGLRYRVSVRPEQSIRRTADIVFTRARVAVFVDGCFWHGCPSHFVPAKSNSDFWAAKIAANQKRDLETDRLLCAAGWTVLRFWEHSPPAAAADAIQAAVDRDGVTP